MAYQHTTHHDLHSIFATVRQQATAFGHGLMQGMEAYAHRKSRMDQMERMNAKTDAELAEMGLRRQDIARHVFADLMNVY